MNTYTVIINKETTQDVEADKAVLDGADGFPKTLKFFAGDELVGAFVSFMGFAKED